MLTIIRSNAVEALLDQLAWRVSDQPLSSPLASEVVVVPSPAMARWVNLQLARRFGVAANVEYPLPASFVWATGRALLDDLPETDPLGRDALTWQVFGLLPELLPEPAFKPLRRYLTEDADGLKRWQLASQIADVLDRYQLYRPQLIRRWQDGDGEDWQAQLWRRLVQGVEGRHRVAVIDRLLGVLGGGAPAAGLPGRISLFALSSLPPLFVQVMHALAAHAAVDLYLHAPTDAFWSDLVSQKALARKRLAKPDEADLWEVGNSLLASWGRQGQALQDLLLDQEGPMEEIDAFVEPAADTLLHRLQRDIFTLRAVAAPDERETAVADASLQVHICHSPLRECQVLHDQLLGILEADPGLRPEDILVMVPEISRYAPYIEAVFDRDRGRPFIPWNLSDIAISDEHPLVQVFLSLLDLADSRFTQSEVLSYLDAPELAEHFGLDGEAVSQMKTWLAQANLRWGLDADHKRRLGLPGVEENTWAQAEARLFGGYALGETDLFEGIAPIGSVEGAKAEVLGRFWRLFSRLTETARRLAAARTAGEWQSSIGALLGDFFGERDDEDGRLQKIRDAVSDLAEQAAGIGEPLHPALVRGWLRERLGAESRLGRYFSGGVTFCGMRPMRSLPFRTTCVLGLHDLAFPRRDRQPELDLMRRDWHPGDPRKGDEDRYLFLETLLCARERLYLSYVGRDIRKNTERQPSVLLRELLDYLDQQYRLADGKDGEKLSGRVTTVHPLQPFSPRNYKGGQASYDEDWCEMARAMQRPLAVGAGQPLHWSEARLGEAPEAMREVTLVQLERFFRHPVRYFVNSRLQVYLQEEETEPDEELFALDGIESFDLKWRLVEARLQGLEPSLRQLKAEGSLPHGAFAELALEREAEKVAALSGRLSPYIGVPPRQVAVDLDFGDGPGPRRLSGQVRGIYPGLGLLCWKPGSLKGADVLGLWLAHLAWCATGEDGDKHATLCTSRGDYTIGESLSVDSARGSLARCLDLYWQGVHRPLPVLPKASFAYARKLRDGGKADPMNAARYEWFGNDFNKIPGDKDDPYIRLVVRGLTGHPLEGGEFIELAAALYGEALDSGVLQ